MTRAMVDNSQAFLIVPRLRRIPWLIHGFGMGAFKEGDFAKTEDLEPFRLVIMRQLHSDIVHRLDSAPAVRLSGDALITDVPGLLLIVRTADCLPVLLVDEIHRAVASVHCGWRGTLARILERAGGEMKKAYGTDPAGLLAALGPCIGPACYEVGPEVKESFCAAGFPEDVFEAVSGRPGKSLLDLRRANAWVLHRLGLKKANVWTDGACTYCDSALISYRRNPHDSRRMYNFIGIRR